MWWLLEDFIGIWRVNIHFAKNMCKTFHKFHKFKKSRYFPLIVLKQKDHKCMHISISVYSRLPTCDFLEKLVNTIPKLHGRCLSNWKSWYNKLNKIFSKTPRNFRLLIWFQLQKISSSFAIKKYRRFKTI